MNTPRRTANGSISGPTLFGNTLQAIRSFAEISGLIALLFYGLGWFFFIRFCGDLNFSPEEIGITPASLLVRAVVAFIPIAVLMLSYRALTYLEHFVPRNIVHIIRAVVAIGTTIVLILINQQNRTVAVGVSVTLFLIGLFTLLSTESQWRSRPTHLMAAVIAIASTLLVVSSFLYAWQIAGEEVKDAREWSYGPVLILPGVYIFRTELVSVYAFDKDQVPKPLVHGCSILLGSSNGTTLLLAGYPDKQLLWRLPTDSISLKEGC